MILVLLVCWAAVGLLVALVLGRAVRVADARRAEEMPAQDAGRDLAAAV